MKKVEYKYNYKIRVRKDSPLYKRKKDSVMTATKEVAEGFCKLHPDYYCYEVKEDDETLH